MGAFIDLTGQKFGRLTVLEVTDKRANKGVVWKCRCDCVNHTIVYVRSQNLVRGQTQSCGCLRNERQFTSEYQILYNKISSRNTSGIKGVHWNIYKQKWRATIRWKKKDYHLLYSTDINDCIAIRKEAEDAVRDGVFEEWIVAYKGRRCA